VGVPAAIAAAYVIHQADFLQRYLYSPLPTQETIMNEAKPVKSSAVEPLVRYTPAEVARNKKARDARRKAIREQNVRSKMK
jgi:hypothetical protein